MALTPLLYLLGVRVASTMEHSAEKERPFDKVEETDHEVIIAGFGRFGQIIARILSMKRIPFTALEASTDQVDFVRRFGNKIYYGDASKLELLRSAEVDKAKVFVLAVQNPEVSMSIARMVRQHFPKVAIYARARNRQHAFALLELGVAGLIRDTFLSSVELGREILVKLGTDPEQARAAVELFREHDEQRLREQSAIFRDEDALVQSAKDAVEQLRRQFDLDAKELGRQSK
jgi:voltage-gated potassium channel Kch